MNLQAREHVARSEEGIAWDRFRLALDRQLKSGDPKVREEIKAMAAEIHELSLTPGSVSTSPVLQNVAVQYRNDELIGTRIMPSVGLSEIGEDENSLSAYYWKKNKQDSYDLGPEDEIGTRGDVNEVEEGFTKVDVNLTRRALKSYIDAWTRGAADAVVRRMMNPTIKVLDRLLLKQEQRIATICTTNSNFGSNTVALSGTSLWTDGVNSDPKANVDTALAALYTGGPGMNVGACSLGVYNVLKTHPKILDAFKYTAGGGYVTRQQLAQYFELDDLYVGRARYNSAAENLTPVYARLWSDVFGVYRVAQPVGVDMVGFGITIESPKFQSAWFENGKGGRGGYNNQIAFADVSKIIASDAGYLITNPIG